MTKRIFLCAVVFIISCTLFAQKLLSKLEKADRLSDSLKYDQAISLLQEILVESEKKKNDSLTISILIKLGSAYLDIEKNDIGINYYHRARLIAQDINNEEKISTAYYGLGAAFQQSKVFDSAEYYYKKSIPFFKDSGDELTLSYIYSNLGLMYFHVEEFDSMKYYSNAALKIQLDIGDKYGSGASYSNLGLIARKNGNYKLSIEYYRQSMNDYSEVSYFLGYSQSLRHLAVTFYMYNQLDSAARYFFIYDSIGHDIYHQDYQDKILELETKFNTAEVERDNAIKQAEIEEKKGQLILLYVFSFALIVIAISTYLFFNQRRKRLKLASDKQIKDLLQNQEIKTTYALLEGQDKERKRVAEELHDGLGSILVTLSMYADALVDKNPKDMPELAKKISRTAASANEETRRISHSLYSGMLKHFGLEAAINQLSEAVMESKPIKYSVEINLENPISTEESLEVYRIIQELTNNSLKHAQCTKIRLELNYLQDTLTIIYEDNGQGFNKNESKKGIGLTNIENRVKKLDGELTIDSSPGKGSAFIIEIPHL
ncbi:tetratricopeptide repeat protein [Ekhidna sp.]|uniref:ATP-binding protein n=1 Tax=Ekhidna sp. TaxID=2608089 RepID=UPI003CCB7A76